MEVKTIKAKFLKGIMDQNTYLVLGEKEAILIDASAEVQDIENELCGRKLKMVLMTHLHFDHIWNLDKIVTTFDCPVYICDGEEKRFTDDKLNASFLIRKSLVKNIDQKYIKYYAENLKTEEFSVNVIKTPGHTKDSVCLLINDYLFSGDTKFAYGIGRTDLMDSSDKDMVNSLRKLKDIKYSVLCPGHGDKI